MILLFTIRKKSLNGVRQTLSFIEVESSSSSRFPTWRNHRLLVIIKADPMNAFHTSLVIADFVIASEIVVTADFFTRPFLMAIHVIFGIRYFKGEFRERRMV